MTFAPSPHLEPTWQYVMDCCTQENISPEAFMELMQARLFTWEEERFETEQEDFDLDPALAPAPAPAKWSRPDQVALDDVLEYLSVVTMSHSRNTSSLEDPDETYLQLESLIVSSPERFAWLAAERLPALLAPLGLTVEEYLTKLLAELNAVRPQIRRPDLTLEEVQARVAGTSLRNIRSQAARMVQDNGN